MTLLRTIALVTGLMSLTFMLNLPLGYVRGRVRRFSLSWFLCIHLPIPFIYMARTASQIDYTFVPVFVIAAVVGQVSGGKLQF